MKKLISLILCMMMVLGMITTAFAASGTNDNSGSITIQDAHKDHTYTIYQILKLKSYDTSANTYIYEPTAAWESWINDSTAGGKYLVVNANGSVKWNGTADETSKKNFVEEAIAYAKSASIANNGALTANGTDEVKFEGLNLGYYLVDTTAGALCSLDTVLPGAVLREKNLIPKVDKQVMDNNGNLGESTTARIGQIVTFDSKVTAYEGTQNLIYHDKMEDALTYQLGSVVVYRAPVSADVKLTLGTDYTVIQTGMSDECTFEVHFTEAFLESLTEATEFHIRYQAELNEKAIIDDPGNVNEAKLTYGDNGSTEWDDAKVFTYQLGIVKTDISNHVLTGAEFELYYQATDGDKIALVKDLPEGVVDPGDVNYYRPATDAEKSETGFVSAKIEAGKAVLWGIRTGVPIYLEETKAPNGYNALTVRFHISALSGSNLPTYNLDGTYSSGGVEVENLAGAQLPQTGGIGTTLFYVFGGIMVAAAVVLLVTKKRMGEEA